MSAFPLPDPFFRVYESAPKFKKNFSKSNAGRSCLGKSFDYNIMEEKYHPLLMK